MMINGANIVVGNFRFINSLFDKLLVLPFSFKYFGVEEDVLSFPLFFTFDVVTLIIIATFKANSCEAIQFVILKHTFLNLTILAHRSGDAMPNFGPFSEKANCICLKSVDSFILKILIFEIHFGFRAI